MYVYSVHSSVPAPCTAARASWESTIGSCLAWGLKARPIATSTAALALSSTILVGGIILVVLIINLSFYLAAPLL